MDQDQSTIRQQAAELEAEAARERDRAQEMLGQDGSVLEAVDLEIEAAAKERQAIGLQREAIKEHMEYLERHPVSSITAVDLTPLNEGEDG